MSQWYEWNKGTQCGVCERAEDNCTCITPWWTGFIQLGVIFAVIIIVLAVVK